MKVNLGCGKKLLDGFVNMDKYPINEEVRFADLNIAIPLDNEIVDFVLLDNVIEHVNDIPLLLNEIERILAKGGQVKIITPHFSSYKSYVDPTHKWHLSYFSMDNFGTETANHYLGCKNLILKHKNLNFGGGIGLISRIIFKISPIAWERYLAFVFRGGMLTYVLEKR